MKSTMRFLISLFFVLTISACSDYFIFTSVPDFLVNTSWSELVGEDDKMYVYQFFDNDGDLSGVRYTCYLNGRILEENSFTWEWKSSKHLLTLFGQDGMEERAVVQCGDSLISFSDGRQWTAYQLNFDEGSLNEGDLVPDDLFEHPDWYDFEKITQWVLKDNGWKKRTDAFIHKQKRLVALRTHSVILACDYKGSGNVEMEGYTWGLTDSYWMHDDVYYVLGQQRPVIILKDDDVVPTFVQTNPEAYGFEYKECWAHFHNFALGYRYPYLNYPVWVNQDGAFLHGSYSNCNIFNIWYYSENLIYSEGGVYLISKGTKYLAFGSTLNNDEYQTHLLYDLVPTLQRVHFYGCEDHTINSRASSYVPADGLTYTGVSNFRVYDPSFTLDKVQVSYSASWLWAVKVSSIVESDGCYVVTIRWGNSANSGSARSAFMYITVNGVQGETYSTTVTINQQGVGGSSGGGSGGSSDDVSSLGPEWTSMSASGYAPYYYCPTTGKTTPANPRATTITVYKNTQTGAYKASWAGKLYNAKRGYNKIAMETESHSVYDERYDYWKSCLDKYYLEFTIND